MKAHRIERNSCTCERVLVKISFVAGHTTGTWSSYNVLLDMPVCYHDNQHAEEIALGRAVGVVALGDDVCFTQLLDYKRVRTSE